MNFTSFVLCPSSIALPVILNMDNQPNSIEKNPSEMQGVTQVVKKFSMYGTQKVSNKFTQAQELDCILHKLNPVHILLPCFIKISFNTILTSICRSPRDFIPSGFPTRTVYTLLISYTTDDKNRDHGHEDSESSSWI
jgi:hypothetical protein